MEVITINQSNEILFYDSFWKIKQDFVELLDNNEIEIHFILFHFENYKWIKNEEFTITSEEKNFKKIGKTIFEMKILKFKLNSFYEIESNIEIKTNKTIELDAKVKRGDRDSGNSSDSKEESSIEEEIPLKKRLKIENKKVEILLFNVFHNENEDYLIQNFINSMTQFNDSFLIPLINKNDIYKKRDPLLCFWELPPLLNNFINRSQLNGKTSSSFQIPLESESISCFTFLETAILLFLFPLNFNPTTKKVIIENEFDLVSHLVFTISKTFHGDKEIKFDSFGFKTPYALQISWDFITSIFRSLINNSNNTDILKLLFKDQFDDFISELRLLMNKIIFKNNKKYDLIIEKIKNELKNKYKKSDAFIENYITNTFVIQYPEIIKYPDQIILLQEMDNYFEFKEIRNDIKNFMLNTWSYLLSQVKQDLIYKNINDQIPVLKLESSLSSMDIEIRSSFINNEYFLEIFNQINLRTNIDLHTLMFLTHFMYLKKDGIFITENSIIQITNNFLEFRDLFSIENIRILTDKRSISFIGAGHNKHLKLLMQNNKDNIDYIINDYNAIFKIKFTTNQDESKYPEFFKQVKLIEKDLYYYLNLEYIDYWLLLSDFGKNNIDSDTSFDQLKLTENIKIKKLNYFTNFDKYFDELIKESNDELKDIVKIISIYIGIILFYYFPLSNHYFMNSIESYFNTESKEKEIMLEKYLYPYISKNKLKIKFFRILGYPFKKFSYYEDNDIENNEIEEEMEEGSTITEFINSLLNILQYQDFVNI